MILFSDTNGSNARFFLLILFVELNMKSLLTILLSDTKYR